MQKITPFLWFDDKAEEAMNFYTSIFDSTAKRSVCKFLLMAVGRRCGN